MLKYQLSYFETLIKQDIKSRKQSKSSPDKAFFSDTVSELEVEKEQILNSLINNLFSLPKEQGAELYIQLHQHNLVVLLDLVTGHLEENELVNADRLSPAITWTELYKRIYHTLRDILTFIEDNFAKYLDSGCKVPMCYLTTVGNKFKKDLQFIEERGKQLACDENLLAIIVSFGNSYITKQTGNFTSYHNLFYLKEVLTRVRLLLTNDMTESEIDEQLHDLLLYFNFNSLNYFYYRTNTIKKAIDDLSTLRAKLDHLSLLQKRVNQAPVKPGFIHSRLHPDLLVMLKNWFIEEIKYLKERESTTANDNILAEELLRWKNFKVLSTLSVPQLGNFLRLLVESEIFLNSNKSELLDFFSHFFTSAKQENISPGSLRANFYKDDAAVSRSVRDMLLTLVNNSRKG